MKKLNPLLKNFYSLRQEKKAGEQIVKKLTYNDPEQGDTGLSYEVYKLSEDIYVKLEINTDSYGDNEFVAGIEFVRPIVKQVTDFEAI